MGLQQAIPHSLKLLLARHLAKSAPLLSRVFHECIPVPFCGFKMDTSSQLIDDATRSALFFNIYESSERRAVKRFLTSTRPIVELGASIGFLSLLVARRVRPHRQVLVEANPKLLPILRRNLELNGISDVTVLHAAVSYGAGDQVAFQTLTETVSGHIADAEVHRTDNPITYVPTLTLGEILHKTGVGEFTLLSDIEGAEWNVINCESASTREHCKQAILELHDIDIDGVRIVRKQIADRMCEAWGMRVIWNDGKVWVFER